MTTVERPRRIVLAEDEAIIRLDLRETLESMGHDVAGETGRGDEALGLIESVEPDIAILDIKMPGRTGLEVAREVTDRHLCAVLILTAFSQAELVQEAADAGVLAYLVKPFQRSELLAALEVAYARYEQMRVLVDEVSDLNERLETRKLIDRAKGQLMDRNSMNESDAFGFIQRTAMSQRTSVREIASQILADELQP